MMMNGRWWKILLTKEVKVKARSRNTKLFESLGYKIPRDKDDRGRTRVVPNATVMVKIEDLPKGSNAIVEYQCDDCGSIHTVHYSDLAYRKNSRFKKNGETLCIYCSNHRNSGQNNPQYKHGEQRYSEYRSNARNRGIEFKLSVEEFKNIVKQPCHYCGGFSSEWNKNSRGNGIDRKNSDIGYIYENCVPCCSKCNFVKNNTPYDKFLIYIRRLYETTKNYKISK
jgi:hypothetical protein